jgi:hypothetical protein
VNGAFTEGNTDLLVIYTADGGTCATGCSADRWVFTETDPRRARAYAALLAAVASGKKVKFWYSDTCGAWGYHQATSVMLTKA